MILFSTDFWNGSFSPSSSFAVKQGKNFTLLFHVILPVSEYHFQTEIGKKKELVIGKTFFPLVHGRGIKQIPKYLTVHGHEKDGK